jgi:O-antigen ligase
MSAGSPSGRTAARWLRRAVIVIGAVMLAALPRFTTNASFFGVPDVPGPSIVLVIGLGFWLMPVLLVASWVAERRATLPTAWLTVPAGLLVLGAAVSTAVASDKASALVRAAEMTGLWVGLFALAQAIRTDAERRFLLSMLVATAVLSAGVAVHQAMIGLPRAWDVFQANREEVLAKFGIEPGGYHEQAFVDRFFGGVQASMGHPNVLAAFLTLGLFVAVGLVREKWTEVGSRGSRGLATVMVAAAVACAAGIVLTQSRAAVAAVAVGLYWLAVAWRVRKRRLRFVLYAAPLVVAAVALAAATQVDDPVVAGAVKTLRYRLDYWGATLKILRRHWETGVGLENFGHHYVQYKVARAPEEVADPHNMLLSTWSTLGLAGVTALVLLAVGTVRVWVGRARSSHDRPSRERERAVSPGEPLLVLLVPVMAIFFLAMLGYYLAGPQEQKEYFFKVGWCLLVGQAAVMAMVIGLGAGEEPSRLETSGRPVGSLHTACVVAVLAFALQEQIGTAILEAPAAWAMFLVVGISLRGHQARRGSDGASRGAGDGGVPETAALPGFALGAAARFLLMLAAMGTCFVYVYCLVRPVGKELALLQIAGWDRAAFDGDEPLRAAAKVNPLAWEPHLFRARAWRREAAAEEGAAAAVHLERAIQAYRDVLKRHPRMRRAYLSLATCYLAPDGADQDPNALAAARACLEEAARLYPTHIPTRLRLAQAVDALGEKAAAVEAYRQVLRLNRLMPVTRLRLKDEAREMIRTRIEELNVCASDPSDDTSNE